MDETESDDVVTVGQRLREAREAKGISIEEIAAQTRIPTRHLVSLESSEWDKLPAPTYSVGFAKNYAGAVGLDRAEISEQLRAEMGGIGSAAYAHPEIYEAADPARTMPKGLVFGALALLAIVVLALTWIGDRSVEGDEPATEVVGAESPLVNEVAPPPPAAAVQPVVLTATDAVWIEVKDGATVLRQGQLAPGQRYEVPASAVAPVLTTGKPEALRISVGNQQAPAIGEPGSTVSGASLKAADLMGAAASPAQSAPAQAAPSARSPVQPNSRERARPAPPPAETPDPGLPTTNTTAPSPGASGETAAQ